MPVLKGKEFFGEGGLQLWKKLHKKPKLFHIRVIV
jgi:hypothetical protein